MDQHTNPRTVFDVTLIDGTSQQVRDANAYQQEQSMTTFFRSNSDRQSFDCWSVRVASFRTNSILSIRRIDSVRGGDRTSSARQSGHRHPVMA